MDVTRPALFGELLHGYRVAAGLTQEELADRARLSARAISDLERGAKTRPHLTTVRQLADALQLSTEERVVLQRVAREGTPAPAATVRTDTTSSRRHDSPSRADRDGSAQSGWRDQDAPAGAQRLPIGGFLGTLPSGPLVARRAELARVLGAVEAVTAGQGQLVLLAGEPGIGKTRLAQDLTLAVLSRGFLVAAGRCYEPQQSVPYYPFLEALAMAHAAAPSTVRVQTAQRWPYLGRLLPDEVGLAVTASADSQEEQARLFRAVTGFVQAIAAASPLALLLDDLHWADSASLQLLQHLARQTRGAAVLLLGTFRDVEVNPAHPLEATLRDLQREQLLDRVLLKRLPERGTAALIAAMMGSVDAGTELSALVHRHTDGNPFFTQQVLRALVDNGSIYRQDGQWKQRALQEMEVPESVRSVIGQRTARLLPAAQEVLQEASVLGPAFTCDDLLAMKAPMDDGTHVEEAVDAGLMAAASLGLVRLTGQDRYAFDHALTQQALYATLSPRRRRRLHRAAGEALEGLAEHRRTQRVAELAWHFLQGDDAERALRYSLLAGDQAESVFAHGEAERHYRTALDLACEMGDRPREAEALEKLGVVLRVVGRYPEGLAVLEKAAQIYRDAGDPEEEGRVMAQVGLLCYWRGAAEEGISRIQPIVDEGEKRGPSRSLALLYTALVRLFTLGGRERELFPAIERLLELARGLQDEHLIAEAEMHRGVSLIVAGTNEDAAQLLESVITRAEKLSNLPTLIDALSFAATAYSGLRQTDRAILCRERAAEIAERLGDIAEVTRCALFAAHLTFLSGDWGRSRAYVERAVTSALVVDNLRLLLQPVYTLGELLLYTGAWEEASHYLEECMTIARHLRLSDSLRETQAMLAEKDLLEEDSTAALARLRSLLDTPGWEEHLNFLLALAATYLAVGDVAAAADAAGRAVTIVTHQRLPLGLVDALRVQGAIATRQGQWEEAESRLRRAVQLAREITYPWGEARALYEYGLLCAQREEPDRAREHFATASTIFARLGAEPYRTRTDQAIAAQSR